MSDSPTLVLLGASGDLAGRFLLPALAALRAADGLPEGLQVVGAARQDWDDAAFRRVAAERLGRNAREVPLAAREALVGALSYRRADLNSPADVTRAVTGKNAATGPIVAYLALPPGLYPVVVSGLGDAELPRGSRIVFEKPFGEDLESAVTLNASLAKMFGASTEQAVFRVDHVLGMATVTNLAGLRLNNRVLEAAWSGEHIEQIDILWEETLALEGRAAYYDGVGALKDVMQNHMLQVLSLVAMEPPATWGERDLRDRKVEALRSIRPLTPDDATARTRRARYVRGRLADTGGAKGDVVPDYAEEDGVEPQRGTETFAEVILELDNPRWAGTRFLLRAGKAMARRRKGVVVRFRPPSHSPLSGHLSEQPANELWIGIDGPDDIALQLHGRAAGPPLRPITAKLAGEPPPPKLPPYGQVLLNILSSDSTLSVRGDEIEEAWRVVTPVLEAWQEGIVPLQEYPAGSDGP